jgi:hypothetical protein
MLFGASFACSFHRFQILYATHMPNAIRQDTFYIWHYCLYINKIQLYRPATGRYNMIKTSDLPSFKTDHFAMLSFSILM